MRKYYRYRTSYGAFLIQMCDSGGWQAEFDGETLGCYPDPQIAVDALVNGRTPRSSDVVDPTTLDLPPDLSEWTMVRVG